MPDDSSGIAVSLSQRAIDHGIGRISLPKPLTSFIGREHELTQAKRLLKDSYRRRCGGREGRELPSGICFGPRGRRQLRRWLPELPLSATVHPGRLPHAARGGMV